MDESPNTFPSLPQRGYETLNDIADTDQSRVYDKIPADVETLIDHLASRKLVMVDEEKVQYYLLFIGYFRLKGYFAPFQYHEEHVLEGFFKPGTQFEDVLGLYVFDRKLRLLLMDALERIEISLRSALLNKVGISYGTHWYMNPALFNCHQSDHDYFINDIEGKCLPKGIEKDIKHGKDSRPHFIQSYYRRFDKPKLPPCWMVFELLSFGTISKIFKWLKPQVRKDVTTAYGLPGKVLVSWFHSLSVLRNYCAHHERTWNRFYAFTPLQAHEYQDYFIYTNSRDKFKLYSQVVVVAALLDIISDESKWPQRLNDLFKQYPIVPLQAMGFPKNWHALELFNS